jgi:hypothetical protein
MRFVNLSATSEKVGKGHRRRLILRKDAAGQSAALPVLAFGDADTGFFQSSDDVLELTTAGVSRMKWDASGVTTISGNLVVSGVTTTIDSTTLTVDDKNIELGSVATPSDTTADGGGITLKGATDKNFNWVNSTDAWTSSEHINLASGKTFQLNGTAITSTAAELNLLSSVSGLVQADLTKLAAVDASATELNYTEGVTSAIQTQMDAKLATTTAASTYAPIASPTFTGTVSGIPSFDGSTALSSLKLTPGTVPGSPAEGQMYYNNTDNLVYVYVGSSWERLDGMSKATLGTGGNTIKTTPDGWAVHIFTANGTFTPAATIDVEYLVVAGGGGGGQHIGSGRGGGGGGAGAMRPGVKQLGAQAYAITVGIGGTVSGGQGGNSIIAGVMTATGGGYGAYQANQAGGAGGSGGGGASTSGAGGAGTTGGNAGGTTGALNQGDNGASGGGGAGAKGGDSGWSNGGAGGGAGLSSNISGLPVVYSKGGNGGAGCCAAWQSYHGAAGAANSGNGGGAGPGNNSYNGGAGGSGIVILRYRP